MKGTHPALNEARANTDEGTPIDDVKRTLSKCVERIATMQNTTFNLIGFGSTLDPLFVTSKPTSDRRAMGTASRFLEQLKADLGGTELWVALRSIFLQAQEDKTPRNIFIFSDGQPTNEPLVGELIKNNSHHTRVFTFGFGNECRYITF